MGVGAGFSDVQNVTLAGGSVFNEQKLAWQRLLNEFMAGAAGVGSDLFGRVLQAQLEANRRPISLVDQFALSGQVGSIFPLSQASQEQIGRFTSRPKNNLLNDLQSWLTSFSLGMLNPAQQTEQGFDPETGVRLTDQPAQAQARFGDSRDALLALQGGDGSRAILREEAGLPLKLAHGGRLTIDPNRAVSSGASIAGPASVVDRTGRTVALAGEAGQRESLTVNPSETPPQGIATGPGFVPRDIQGGGEAPGQQVPGDEQLRRDEQFRFDEITRVRPDLSFSQRMSIAKYPGGFEQYVGVQTDPRAAAARSVGTAIGGDTRFRDPLVRSLSMGRAPSPGELNAEEWMNLSPDLQDALISVVGPDLAQQFFFELQAFTPRGRSTRIAGPVAA